jgi:low affinity Fe/Cu permease
MAQTATKSKTTHKAASAQPKPASVSDHTPPNIFERFAHATAFAMGKPIAFLLALAVVLVWATTGPFFGFSDTWQLVINTGTTIVTFLMVFLIQQSQNRDTRALQIKLAELIIAVKGANDKIATAEDLSEHDLQLLHDSYCKLADQTREHLESRRRDSKK